MTKRDHASDAAAVRDHGMPGSMWTAKPMIETDEAKRARLRKLWRAFCVASLAQCTQREANDRAYLEALRGWADSNAFLSARPREPIHPPLIPFPEELRGLTCGAKTRAGAPCKLSVIYSNGRCKFHGGLSTGPRTAEGMTIASRNARKQTP